MIFTEDLCETETITVGAFNLRRALESTYKPTMVSQVIFNAVSVCLQLALRPASGLIGYDYHPSDKKYDIGDDRPNCCFGF